MKKIQIVLLYMILLPVCGFSQFTGGNGRGDHRSGFIECQNPLSGGAINGASSIASGSIPSTLGDSVAPSGYNGTLQYQWQYSVTSSGSGFSDISGATGASYSPVALTVTTWYRRLSKVSCNTTWSAAASSNVVQVTVMMLKPGTIPTGLCPSGEFNLVYHSNLNFVAGNVISVELSDGSGGFTSPVVIGSLTTIDTSGSIPVVIPLNTSSGSGYRIRLTSSNVASTGKDNGTDLAIGPLEPASVTVGEPSASCDGNVIVTSQGSSIYFDGTNDYITLPNTLGSTNNFTVEGWIYWRGGSYWQRFFDFGNNSNQYFELSINSSTSSPAGYPRFTIMNNSPQQLVYSSIAFPQNVWTHIAVTIDKTTSTGKMLINGTVVGTATISMTPADLPTTYNNYLGKSQYAADPYLNGEMDEVRFWNVARTPEQIQASLYIRYPEGTPGLVSYYKFDDGSGTTTKDEIGFGNYGTLKNGARWITPSGSPSGSTYASYLWSTGDTTGTITVSDPGPNMYSVTVTNSIGCQAVTDSIEVFIEPCTNIRVDSVLTEMVLGSTFSIPYHAVKLPFGTGNVLTVQLSDNSGDFTNAVTIGTKTTTDTVGRITIAIPSGTSSGPGYRIRLVSSNGAWTGTPPRYRIYLYSPPGNALNFDGSNDYVTTTTAISNPQTFTIESWFRTTYGQGGIVGFSNAQSVTGSTACDRMIYLSADGKVNVLISSNASNKITSPNAYNDGYYHHVAASYSSGTGLKLYVDGVLVASNSGLTSPISGTGYWKIGGMGTSSLSRYFRGNIDEVKIWNTVRTIAQIQAGMNTQVSPDAAGTLTHYFRFNNGASTTLYDLSVNHNNGVLKNFAMTGTTSNWTESYAMVVPQNLSTTNLSIDGFKANWTAPITGTTEKYLLDVSTSPDFSTFLTGYNGKDMGLLLSETLTGLNRRADYFWRVRSEKSSVSGQGGNAIQYVDGIAPGMALKFNGTNEYVDVPGGATSYNNTTMTIEAWIRTSTTGATAEILGWGGENTTTDCAELRMNSGKVQFGINTSGNWSAISSVNPVNYNKWVHVAIVKSNTSVKLYINGELDGTGTLTGNPAANLTHLTIGGFYYWGSYTPPSGTYWFNGSIDEVRIWSYCRSQTQLKATASLYDHLTYPAPGLVNYYRFSNLEGTSIRDLGSSELNAVFHPNGNPASSFVESYAMVVPLNTTVSKNTGDTLTLNWEIPNVYLWDKYLLEVATDSLFTSYVTGYNNKDVGTALTCTLTGVQHLDKHYYWKVKAEKSSVSLQADGHINSFWTQARRALPPSVTNPTANSLDVTINVNGNPATVTYAIQDSASGKFVQANGTLGNSLVWQSALVWGTKTVNNLLVGSSYYFRVKARNSNNDTTRFSLTTLGITCKNPSNGGTIGYAQSVCLTVIPQNLVSLTSPSNYGGTLEYKWQSTTLNATTGFADITGATGTSYQPPALTDTTWFRRLSRVSCKADWTGAVSSNVVKIACYPYPFRISGYVQYNNNPLTPLDGIKVILRKNANQVDSVITNTMGFYQFSGLTNGTYGLTLKSAHPSGQWQTWGGVNNTDAFLVLNHINNITPLATNPPVIRVSASVKAPHPDIDMADYNAIRTATKYANGYTFFEISKWLFSGVTKELRIDTITLNCGDVSRSIRGLCSGDVNATFVPTTGYKSVEPSLSLYNEGIIPVNDEMIFPVNVGTSHAMSQQHHISAITLLLDFDPDVIEITKVEMPGNSSVRPWFDVISNDDNPLATLKIGWISMDPVTVGENNPLLLIYTRLKNPAINSPFSFRLNEEPISELADPQGNVISDVRLTMPVADNSPDNPLQDGEFSQVNIWPNPADETVRIDFNAVAASEARIELYDLAGRMLNCPERKKIAKGFNRISLDIRNYSNGSYLLKLIGGMETATRKLVISR